MARDTAKEIQGNKSGVIPFCLQVQRTLEGPWWTLCKLFRKVSPSTDRSTQLTVVHEPLFRWK